MPHFIVKLRLAAAVLACLACTLEYGERLAEELEQTPNSIIEGFESVSIRANRPRSRIQAAAIESYNSTRRDQLRSVTVEEFDSEGKVQTRGSAESAVIDQATRDASLRGVVIESEIHRVRLEAADLQWEDRRRRVTGSTESRVRIEREKKLVLEGSGFTADLDSATLRFDRGVQGEYDEGGGDDSRRTP